MILISGATGTIGKHVCERGDPSSLKLLVRNATSLSDAVRKKFQWVEGDFGDPESLEAALQGIETALLLTKPSPSQYDYDQNFISSAKKAGVRKIVKISALGAATNATSELNRWQFAGENLLKESGLDYVILRPQFFMQNLLMISGLIKKKNKFGFPLGDTRVAMIDAADIASAVLSVCHANEFDNGVFSLTGAEATSMYQVAKLIGDLRGEPVVYEEIPDDAYISVLEKSGLPSWSAQGLGKIYRDIDHYENYSSQDIVQLTGRVPKSLENFLKQNKAQFL